NSSIIEVFNLTDVNNYLYLIPLVIVFSGIMQVLQQWLIRTEQFSINARSTFYRSLIINSSKAGFGFINPVPSVLVFLTAIGNVVSAFLMLILLRARNSIPKTRYLPRNDKRKSIKQFAKKYIDFPIYRAPESFLNATSQGLPVLLLSAFFGPASAGYYTIGWTVLSLPARLIGDAVGDVFYPRVVSAVENKEKVSNLIKKATLLLSLFGIIPFGVIILGGPFLFDFIFGNEWIVAGEYARWIALFGFTNFVKKPSIRSLAALNAQSFHLGTTVFMLIIRLIFLGIGFFVFADDVITVALFSISGAILNICLIFIVIKLGNKKANDIIR